MALPLVGRSSLKRGEKRLKARASHAPHRRYSIRRIPQCLTGLKGRD